jgi:hypothetical protein
MKTQLLTLILILFSTIVFCQETEETTDKIYITNETIIVDEFNISEKQVLNTKYIAVKGTRFIVHDSIDEKLIIKFWSDTDSLRLQTITTEEIPASASGGPPPPPPVFTSPEPPTKIYSISYKYVSFNTNVKYFLLELEDYKQKTSVYENRK